MTENVSLTVAAEFSMKEGASEFFEQCSRYAKQLSQLLGKGVSVYFFSKGMLHPMASFRYKGAELGRISLQDGRSVIPFVYTAGWTSRLVPASPRNVWHRLFRPHLKDIIENEGERLRKLETVAQTCTLPRITVKD